MAAKTQFTFNNMLPWFFVGIVTAFSAALFSRVAERMINPWFPEQKK